ncbi:hypothetical protein Riv7116_1747 [Rivularia sp. PCC 7116]|uniref:hypothetical protein n=1 Tax=Rivularia sp. PCC 7116 TaxID=373994 RepID=UPI00029F13ED|nr:hypothetical protein [Rivularia sp. PCC 7116]AFY54292.1 hypothetical protein Riv7116_1747 [Rivularia sp. PCC 7116]
MQKQIDFRWRYQPCKPMDIKLMKHIQSNLMAGKTQMMLVAVRSFWLTHAIANDSNDEKEVQRIARSCIQALRKQAQEIVELAGLEDAPLKFLTQNSSSSNSHDRALHSNNNDSENHVYDDAGLSNFM